MKSKFVDSYQNFFERGIKPSWHELFSIDVDKQYLANILEDFPPDACLAQLKPHLNELFRKCLKHIGSPSNQKNVLETLVIFIRSMLRKQFAGWEVMQVFAGDVSQSDRIFDRFATVLLRIIESGIEKESNQHRAIELGLVFMCSIDQLSPGAYFLRHDFLRATCRFIRRSNDPSSHPHSLLFLSALTNYHRTDAAQLNPYPAQLAIIDEREVFNKALVYYSSEAQMLVNSYQAIVDDTPPTLYATFSGFFVQLKPGKVLVPATIEKPSMQFADMPPPNAIFLVSLYDLLIYNKTFLLACAESEPSTIFAPLLSAFSYIMTNAWSPINKRASTYARIVLNTMLLLVEDQRICEMVCTSSAKVHVCKQRRPFLPDTTGSRPLACGVLDCSILFLRHNLHKDLDSWAYSTCFTLIHRVIFTLTLSKEKLDYHWHELWKSLIMVLQFLSVKTDEILQNKRSLLMQILSVLSRALYSWERYLQKVDSVSQLLFEIVRAEPTFSSLPHPEQAKKTVDPRAYFAGIAEYYNEKIREDKKVRTAEQVMGVITRLVDHEGVFGMPGGMTLEDEEIKRPANVHTLMGFSRLLYTDGVHDVT